MLKGRAKFLEKSWVIGLARFFSTAIYCIGFVSVIIGLASATHTDGNKGWAFFVFIPVFVLAAVAIHESGHFVAARRLGMLVSQGRILFFELLARQHHWKMRMCRPQVRTRASGYVVAIPNFSRSVRRQFVFFALGGPAANITATVVFSVLGAWALSSDISAILFAFAMLNFCYALANLIPNARIGSDGYIVIKNLFGEIDEASLTISKLLWLSYEGTTAERLPISDLKRLDEQPEPMPLLRRWFSMKAAQNESRWADAVSEADASEENFSKLDASLRQPGVLLMADFFRIERAFSQAMFSENPVDLPESAFESTAWSSPHLKPRCQALNYALSGDISKCEELLVSSQTHANESLDRALHESEATIRNSIRAKCKHAACT